MKRSRPPKRKTQLRSTTRLKSSGKRKPRTTVDVDEAVRLYREGLTQPEIAGRLGCDSSAISRALRRAGEPTRIGHPPCAPIDNAEAIRLYRSGLGVAEVARRLGVSTVRMNKLLRQLGVVRRPGRPRDKRPSYQAEFERQRPLVRRRSRGRCEAQTSVCTGRAVHVHHRKPRGRRGSNALVNLLDTCVLCHKWIHDHPKAANAVGLLLHSWQDESTPIG